jgi:peptide-methionine (S)-S-oxide reductase
MRQGNDVGSGYRSAIFVHDEAQRAAAETSKAMFQEQLSTAGYGTITTEIVGPPAPPFYFAEEYHQQYLDKVPNGYCPNHSTGVRLPEGFGVTPLQYVD